MKQTSTDCIPHCTNGGRRGRSTWALLALALLSLTASEQLRAQAEWKVLPLPEASEATLTGIRFIDDRIGYITGYEGDGIVTTLIVAWRTTDGGTTWEKIDLHDQEYLSPVFFNESIGAGYGWSTDCSCPYTASTTDGGETWQTSVRDDMKWGFSIQRIGGMTAYMTGGTADNTTGLITTDGGATWSEHGSDELPLGFVMRQVMSENQWYGYAQYSVVRSDDGGETWSEHLIPQLSGAGRIRDVHFIDESTGIVAVGINGPVPEIYRTSDAGESWERVYASTSYPYEMDNVAFIDENTGFAVAGDGNVVVTTDAGKNWEIDLKIGAVLDLVRHGETVWAVGESGLLQRRSASAWEQIPPHISPDVESVAFGQVLLGSSDEVTVEIANTGGQELEITEISIEGGGDALEITQSPNLPLSFMPGLSISVGLEYSPVEKGTLDAALVIRSNDPDMPTLSIPISGTATDQITSVDISQRGLTGMRVVPNPIGVQGGISLRLDRPIAGSLDLYDMRGAHVATLHAGDLPAGAHTFHLDRLDQPSGTYRCVLTDRGTVVAACSVLR